LPLIAGINSIPSTDAGRLSLPAASIPLSVSLYIVVAFNSGALLKRIFSASSYVFPCVLDKAMIP